MEPRTHCRAGTLAALLLSLAMVIVPARVAWADAAPALDFHIEGGDATTTLTEFSRQAHLQLLFDYNIVKGHLTRPLDGHYPAAEALERLLATTDLEFDFVNERTLAVTRKKPPEEPKLAAGPKPEPRRAKPPKLNTAAVDGQSNPVDVVRITGTYLHNAQPVGQERINPNRDDIDKTGSVTVAEFLSTLPQTFGGGPNQGTTVGQEAQTNSGFGVGTNLRGLGARATLVLIDGRRVAPSGTEGEFVDIANIPLVAVDHIDVLPDSASAIYGADAVGGAVNFMLRNRLDGAETIALGGSGTRGDLQEYLFSQALGTSWDGGHGLVAFEFYDRGSLPAAHRAYAQSDLTSFGGGDFDTTNTNPGNLSNPLTHQVWAIPHGQNGAGLTAADLIAGGVNHQNSFLGDEIIPSQRRYSFYATGREALGDRMSMFADVLAGHREASQRFGGAAGSFMVPASNPFYPVGLPGPLVETYNFGKDLGPATPVVGVDTLNATTGLDVDIGASWALSLYGSFSREKQNLQTRNLVNFSSLATWLADPNPATAFNPFGDGSYTAPATLSSIRSSQRFWLNSQLKSADVTADGPIAQLPGGALKLAVGADRRAQEFDTDTTPTSVAPAQYSRLARGVTSAFGELVAPLVCDKNAVPGIARLELSGAARFEDYSTFGSSTTPKIGIAWSPWREIFLRGTWSRAQRPPTLADLNTAHNQAASTPLPDASLPAGAANTLVWQGGNSAVQPEKARSWTAGLDLAPKDEIPGLALGFTYFNTVFSDRIQSTILSADILTNPAYAAVVTHNPTAAQVDAVCSQATYVQGSTAQCTASGAQAIVDLRVRNLATLVTQGIDFNSRYEHPLPLGSLNLGVNGTYLLRFAQSQTPDEALTSLLSTQNEPVNLRMRATAGWDIGGFSSLLAANYTNSYHDTASDPQRRISSWTTIDIQLRYDFSDDSGWLHGVRLELNGHNVFNVDPPFLNNQVVGLGFDQENANPYGRTLNLEVRKSW